MTGQTSFKPEYTATAHKLASLGATDREIADVLGVSERTINRWKHTQPDFSGELRLGKEAADDRVEQSLYRRAIGYTYDAVKVFTHNGQPVIAEYVEHIPPDTTAAIFWLKNRRSDDWRDKQHLDFKDTSRAGEMDDAARAVRLAAIAARSNAFCNEREDNE